MIRLEDICSLSDFQRNAREHIARLKQTGRPAALTVNGQAEIVVQDAASYQKLLDELDRAQAAAAVQRGLSQARNGAGRPAEEVFAELRQKQNRTAG